MEKDKKINILYIFLDLLIVVSSYLYSLTNGLIYDVDASGMSLYTNDLMSTGSDDNLCIEIGMVIFLIPLLYRLVRIKKNINRSDYSIFAAVWLVQLVFLFAIEAGSIWKTLLYSYNFVLMIWLSLFFISIVFIGFRFVKWVKTK